MKKVLIIIGSSIAILMASLAVAGIVLYQNPGVKFILTISEIIKPSGFTKTETILKLDGSETPMLVFTPKEKKTNKYYFFLHGFTPQAFRHPSLSSMAAAICTSTGRTVFVPYIQGITKKGWSLAEVAHEVSYLYLALRKQHPGRYNAFGACVAGTGLLVAFNNVTAEEYPDKLLLYGPFFTGQLLTDYYNKAGIEVDYIVKMANALNSRDYSTSEVKLVNDAILASKPGTTDRDAMRAILGDSLFIKIDKAQVDNKEFLGIKEGSIFTKGKKIPGGEFFIIHSTSDNIIPYTSGLALHKFLMQCGAKSRFVATNIFSHSEKKLSLMTMRKELADLIVFFDDLFKENN